MVTDFGSDPERRRISSRLKDTLKLPLPSFLLVLTSLIFWMFPSLGVLMCLGMLRMMPLRPPPLYPLVYHLLLLLFHLLVRKLSSFAESAKNPLLEVSDDECECSCDESPRDGRNERRGREASSPHAVRVENKGALLRDSLHAPPVLPGEGNISGRSVHVHASACEVPPKAVNSARVGSVNDRAQDVGVLSLMACCKRTAIRVRTRPHLLLPFLALCMRA